jgi:hypothetical protein
MIFDKNRVFGWIGKTSSDLRNRCGLRCHLYPYRRPPASGLYNGGVYGPGDGDYFEDGGGV